MRYKLYLQIAINNVEEFGNFPEVPVPTSGGPPRHPAGGGGAPMEEEEQLALAA